jgi:hypothetical protein
VTLELLLVNNGYLTLVTLISGKFPEITCSESLRQCPPVAIIPFPLELAK